MVCTVCDSNPGEPAELAFTEDSDSVSLEMCEDCIEGFRAYAEAEVARIGPEVAQ